MKRTDGRTTGKVIVHALGTALGGFAVAWLLSMLGAKLGLASDPTGWRQLAYAVIGALGGLLLGLWLTAWGLGHALRFRGSGLGGLIGMFIGAAVLFLSLRLASGNAIGTIVGPLLTYACVLIGYHMPWRK